MGDERSDDRDKNSILLQRYKRTYSQHIDVPRYRRSVKQRSIYRIMYDLSRTDSMIPLKLLHQEIGQRYQLAGLRPDEFDEAVVFSCIPSQYPYIMINVVALTIALADEGAFGTPETENAR